MRSPCIALLIALLLGVGAPAAVAAPLNEAVTTISTSFKESLNQRGEVAVAIYGFSELNGYQSALGDFLAEELMTSLVGGGAYRVIERRELDRILQEHNLYGKDLFDPQTLPELRKLKGIDLMITGSLTKLSSQVRVNARILDVATTTAVGASSASIDRDDDVNALLGESAKSTAAGRPAQAMPEGLVAQPSDVGLTGRFFRVSITGVTVENGGKKVIVSAQITLTAKEAMYLVPGRKTDSVKAQTELGEIYGDQSPYNELVGLDRYGTLVQPDESFLVTWLLNRGEAAHGSKLSLRSNLSVKTTEGPYGGDSIETPIVINNIRLR